jgi:hypothetical protein
MTNQTIDLLQIEIEKAKKNLPEDTVNAIAMVDWKAAILKMREKYGYSFEQLGDLELETELVLCGLLSPADYPKEVENRLKISSSRARELVNEMNDLVFKKIREELIKSTERKKTFINKEKEAHEELTKDLHILKEAGIEIAGEGNKLPVAEKLEISGKVLDIKEPEVRSPAAHPILAQKLSGFSQSEVVKTEHTLENITKTNTPTQPTIKSKIPSIDPYREIPE